jgi:1,4-alpha-glucan branching enzyme
MVILEVVLNHFGTGGNHWVEIAPIFTDKHENQHHPQLIGGPSITTFGDLYDPHHHAFL